MARGAGLASNVTGSPVSLTTVKTAG